MTAQPSDGAFTPTDVTMEIHATPDRSAPRSRRSLLAAAAAAIGAVAAHSMAAVVPGEAATGSTMKAGQGNTATGTTTVKATGPGVAALKGLAANTTASTTSIGVVGQSSAGSGTGVRGIATTGTGVAGEGASVGVRGTASGNGGTGVYGVANSGSAAWGVGGISSSGHGVHGESSAVNGVGVYGADVSANGTGVYARGNPTNGYGVRGEGRFGLSGRSSTDSGYGVHGSADGPNSVGVQGTAVGADKRAGAFDGTVWVYGTLNKTAGSFVIDHPLDPENRYLAHSFVESPEMLNVYSGTARLDAKGRATVRLPRYFEALNMEHRYQLTPIGGPAPELHVAEKIKGNRFAIAGGAAGQEVCWQVTGVRQDAYAQKHRIKVDTAKKPADRGRYISPDAFGKRRTAGIGYSRPPRQVR